MKSVVALLAVCLVAPVAASAQAAPFRHYVIQPASNGVYVGAYGGARSNEGSCEGLGRAVGQPMRFCVSYYTIRNIPNMLSDGRNNGEAIPFISMGCAGTTYSDIASGREDSELQRDAGALKAYASQHPQNPWIMLRPFHEFNMNFGDPPADPNGNNCFTDDTVAGAQQQFKSAFQHVVSYFGGHGVTNVTYVWCPAVGPQAWRRYGGDFLAGFYPGDNYVDWNCADTYDKTRRGGGGGVANAFAHMSFFKRFNKPVVIGEFGECNTEARSARCANYVQSQAAFFADIARMLKPGGELWNDNVKAILYFDQFAKSGYNWSLDSAGRRAFAAMLADPYFHPALAPPAESY